MELNKNETEALIAYFDETTINITKMIKKLGVKKWREIEAVIDKLYTDDLDCNQLKLQKTIKHD